MPDTPPGGRPSVLVVDDDDDIRAMTGVMLQRNGFDVLLAADAAQAILTCRLPGTPVDVLLTDLQMPGITGGELARAVAALDRDIEIVYISGVARDEALSRGLIRPDARLISKPFTAALLANTLREALNRTGRGPGGPAAQPAGPGRLS